MSALQDDTRFSKPLIYMLIGSAFILALSLGVRHGFGLYLVPMSHEFNWSHQVFSLAIAMQNLLWGAVQPFTGALADKYGSKKVVAVGGVLYTIGLLLMSVSSNALLLDLSVGLIIGLALSATSFSVLLSAVGRAAHPSKRSMAMGIASAAGSFGQFIMLPTTLLLIKNFGWSSALVITAVLVVLIIPLAWMLKAPMYTPPNAVKQALKPSLTFKQILNIAFHHKPFLWLAFGFLVCGFQVVFLGIHLPGYLIDHGFDASTGTVFLALVGLFNIVGTYAAGWLGDKYSKPHLLMGLYGLRGVTIIAFLMLPLSIWTVYAFGIIMGILWLSTVPLTNGIVANMFGVKYLTMLSGIVFFTHQVGSFFGGWLGGLNHDITGNYNIIWGCSIALSLFGVIVHFFVNEEAVVDD
ncbi:MULTISPECIES: MFS transporter [Acinetobacter]|jgi:predicted MFS family arabinose efflux permease|uniref:MFS transporter n=1 Tax=Acinetobacter bereziniae TaxID=106648 RepID=A0A0A8TFK2_ACIBZ|nr:MULTISPECIES: MFS transporter [Acinetobacter]MEC8122512.1 MFS transporter [Pseudomonadota bacterium]ELW79833.1 transporter, major facilitator family protein [Acinetobacter sp. WC-743]KKW76191.1 MFS transporter [Acinetobacter sp. Ag2]MBI0395284.1 MFS transporter [Acinetobacter bereziniae]MBJ8425984.1 MFS transporter [Acinetobacter bereziniae]